MNKRQRWIYFFNILNHPLLKYIFIVIGYDTEGISCSLAIRPFKYLC